MNKYVSAWLLITIIFLSGCKSESETTNLTVSAASSMAESLQELKKQFEAEHPSIKITYNFGGTGTLRKQVEQGAPVDLFFMASETDYYTLKEKGFIEKGQAILSNRLVFIQDEDKEWNSFEQFLNTNEKLAIGTPEAVPAGTYSMKALQQLGSWDELQKRGRLMYAKDVQHVLTLVEEGAIPAGIVYYTDIQKAHNIKLVEKLDEGLYGSIDYFLAITSTNKATKHAADIFYQYVLQHLKLFESYQFQMNNELEKMVDE
ncbi:molybdate transport system substrate-binding protein [Salirhabdus euzebyi]|uniref:Molybdate transport system substrate-binding protein n=1 Tax=Salirhabdus euzebyi TaxID=394506 RepID=A0A841Q6L5_9BACI|nr:molybdate ABC transporter substrate-binding protein [Salirhabdus euzebyi]MBB6454041.1 molybdate transport system substrate-binding protein [Salirhabdus euzebyi]